MHAATLSRHAQTSLAALGGSGLLDNAHLAGGSALALHLGHRHSYDFDFYTRKIFSAENFAAALNKIGKFRTSQLEHQNTLLGDFNGAKFSLFYYDYPLIEKPVIFKNIAVAAVSDIAAMKLSAITGRATKRDYIDIFVISQKYSLEKQFRWYQKKFGALGNNLYFIIKALGYFEDAEADDMPKLIKPINWEAVKEFLVTQSLRLARKHLG